MGYTTKFEGSLTPDKPFTEELTNYINRFSRTRHIRRNTDAIKTCHPGWQSQCWEGKLGNEGEYFIGDDGGSLLKPGFKMPPDVLDYNEPPKNCPGLWCQWVISDGRLMWNQGEKFYDYIEWLQYLIDNFFAPSGYILAGDIRWQGERIGDCGIIHVENNKVTTNNLL